MFWIIVIPDLVWNLVYDCVFCIDLEILKQVQDDNFFTKSLEPLFSSPFEEVLARQRGLFLV